MTNQPIPRCQTKLPWIIEIRPKNLYLRHEGSDNVQQAVILINNNNDLDLKF